MDAGRIKSFTPNVNLRADVDQQSPRRSDAGAVAAKLAPAALLLDALNRVDDASVPDALAPGHLVPVTRSGVVVNLSLPLLTAKTELQFARAIVAADYSHLDPKKTASALSAPRPGATAPAEPSEPVSSALIVAGASGAQATDRAAPSSPLNSTSPDARPDLHPHAHPLAGLHQQSVAAAEPRVAASAVSQARDTERLAGLAVPPEALAPSTDPHLGKLVLGAIALGVLVLVLL